MTSSTTLPNRHRRRIVTIIALLVAALYWWFCPVNVDPRFVGTWTWIDEKDPGRSGVVRFESDGTATLTYSNSRGENRSHWRVDGDRLALGNAVWRQSKLVTGFDSIVERLVGSRFRLSDAHWTIQSLERDRIALTSPPFRWTLIRERPSR